ncbi:mucin-1 [Theristicus caerulescens]
MAFTALLLLLVLGAGTRAMDTNRTIMETPMPGRITTETTVETTMTDTTTMETTTTDTTTTETTTKTTTKTTTTPVTAAPNITISKNTSVNGTQTSHTMVFLTASNTTKVQSSNSSAGNAAANSTAAPVSHANATTNSSNWVPPFGTNTTTSSSAVPTSPGGGGMVIPVSSTKGSGNSSGNSSAQVMPTWKTSVTAQGNTAPRQTPMAALGSTGGPNQNKATAQLLLRVLLSFRILNRSFNESLRDPTSKDYRSLSHAVLTMFEYVFGCASCMGQQTYKGCSELRFSQGSVEVQSTLVFGHGNDTVTGDAAEQQLRKSLDKNGFIMDLQLASIQSTVEVTSPAPVPAVPDWAIALLVLVCILLLLSILNCLLMTTCSWKSRGKLDLFSTKDSYHPMAEYSPYQSHGRYMSPNSKPNPYSQVAGSKGAASGTFTYTNPASGSDNL